ncbi:MULTISPECIES: methionine ABC transporter ATP-binding protein [unclassified Sporosarcina]|uniref:methionine ABC transporter ATP-binding protein n=1 Tax=unclassified Sporosarcina TaxID=2647733 RepID=UPI002041C493|nr:MULTISPECIES: ATP-binding cassette domain-containing protein [unclassified Sporosarcina]GKV64054.1 methionine import ATP-binding protein MetN [Sporosarcina sp. NCCP-2331]GLB56371.1 methionine import ATP-binding protein MetN [Sporosarcina sp. NCCP-2378]
MIEFTDIGKQFTHKGNTIVALDDVSLTIDKGDIYGVIGYSGAGKSTLLRMVNALEAPTAGNVKVKGKVLGTLSNSELSQVKKNIGMVFQHFNLLESKTVFENIAIPLVLNKVNKKEIQTRVRELLEFVGLADKEKNYPAQLSGGQKQRVGIARALVTNPEILLCDEATSALDPKTTLSILNLLKQINENFNITILVVTHEMEVIREICNKVAVMENGRVIESGHVLDVFGNPQNPTTKGFVKTVIHDEIPPSVIAEIQDDRINRRIFQFKFLGKNSTSSLLFELSKQFTAEIKILFANVTELQGTTLGIFTVAFYADDPEIERMVRYVKEKEVLIQEVKL